MTSRPEAFFASPRPGPLGARFCLWHAPTGGAPKALIVYVHPFAEEMNKSRRMAALQSRALAANGYAVLQMDLLGCGDSAGDSEDATWAIWIDDVIDAVALARQRAHAVWPGGAELPLWLWGLRSGCLLASEVASRLETPVRLLCWQPALSGKAVLQQFLRLDAVGMMLGKSGSTRQPSAHGQLAAGRNAIVAGYVLTPALAQGLERARLEPRPQVSFAIWIDVVPRPETQPSPVTVLALAAWAEAGIPVRHSAAVGPSFWQTTEIEDAPALLSLTLRAMNWTPDAAPPAARGVPNLTPCGPA